MKRTAFGLIFALALVVLGASSVFAGGWAFDTTSDVITDNNQLVDGSMLYTGLTDVQEVPGNIVVTLSGAGNYNGGVYAAQPLLRLRQSLIQGSFSGEGWTGFGMCIDTAHLISVGPEYSDYHVYDWAHARDLSRVGHIDLTNGDQIWDKLTTMWTLSSVTSDDQRSALQIATWLGCADNWWNGTAWTNPGAALHVSGMTAALEGQVKAYSAQAATGGKYEDLYRVVQDGNAQTMVVAVPSTVPEPGTVVAVSALLAPAGLLFRRKRSA